MKVRTKDDLIEALFDLNSRIGLTCIELVAEMSGTMTGKVAISKGAAARFHAYLKHHHELQDALARLATELRAADDF